MHLNTYTHMCVYIYASTNTHTHTYAHTCSYQFIYTHTNICTQMSINIYASTHTHMHTQTHTHTYGGADAQTYVHNVVHMLYISAQMWRGCMVDARVCAGAYTYGSHVLYLQVLAWVYGQCSVCMTVVGWTVKNMVSGEKHGSLARAI
jgi:hypothetical protein